ncbi:MAG: rhodanese-like domain-containing protein [Deltaproteobacteria bacterium]|nr:rhodanese-like domain-containing protein [Deltaproteobacteria bacterium]
MKSISAQDLKNQSKGKNEFLLDVRKPDEHQVCRIEGAALIPLDSLEAKATEIPKDRPVYVYCRSGNRSRQAIQRLESLGFENLVNIDGGIVEYEKCGGAVVRLRRGLPLMQQVQVVAGTLILIGTLLAWLVHPAFLILTGFVGTGLAFAGLTGFCGMAQLLGRMPWNRTQKSCPNPQEALS